MEWILIALLAVVILAQSGRNKKSKTELKQEKQLAETKKDKKVPLSVKLATSAVVGYKAGKKIGKW